MQSTINPFHQPSRSNFRGIGPTANDEDFSRFFCSELCAAALEETGVIARINASEVTPAELCGFNLYGPDYVQLKGKKS